MELIELLDRLFDAINETDNLPVENVFLDEDNKMNIYLKDGTRFSLYINNYGKWWIRQPS
ncbi:hypothetical protein [Eisenbergiella sp.]